MKEITIHDVLDAAKAGERAYTSQEVTIDKRLAGVLLSANRDNRPIKPEVVKVYSQAMMRGHWDQLPFGAIQLGLHADGDLVLVDGQHRLMAVVDSGISIRVVIASAGKTPRGALGMVIDVGKKRSVAEITGINSQLASVSATLLRNDLATSARRAAQDPADIERIATVIEPDLCALRSIPAIRKWSSAASCAGMVLRMRESAMASEYVLAQYRAISDPGHNAEMTLRTAAALRVDPFGAYKFARHYIDTAYAVFDPKKQATAKIVVDCESVREGVKMGLYGVIMAAGLRFDE